ncbi:MAG: double zinc ribbon domain-containing protein [Thermoleophilia bacterium]
MGATTKNKPNTAIELPEPGVLSELLSFLFPLRCAHCGTPGNWLCPDCAGTLAPLGPGLCQSCGRPQDRFTRQCPECRGRQLHYRSARAAFAFDGPARSLVHRLKFSGQRRLASFMAAISLEPASELTAKLQGASLTSVPLHGSRMISRGYNQSSLYARAMARLLGLPFNELLHKNHHTVPQNTLDFQQRRNNLIDGFSLRKGANITGGHVILVDDVYTTGATADACAGVLKAGLGVEVDIWTFARTVRR